MKFSPNLFSKFLLWFTKSTVRFSTQKTQGHDGFRRFNRNYQNTDKTLAFLMTTSFILTCEKWRVKLRFVKTERAKAGISYSSALDRVFSVTCQTSVSRHFWACFELSDANVRDDGFPRRLLELVKLSWSRYIHVLVSSLLHSLIELSVIEQRFVLKNADDAWNVSHDLCFVHILMTCSSAYCSIRRDRN